MKNLTKVSLMALVAAAYAAPAKADLQHRGPYVGVQVGHGTGAPEVENNYNGNNGKSDIHADGVLGGIFAGWAHSFGKFFIAGEISGEMSNFDGKTSEPAVPYSQKIKRKDKFGVNLRVGMDCKNVTPYITAGWTNAKWELRTGFPAAAGGETKKSNRHNGYEVGFGVDVEASKNLTVGGQYTHARYSSKTIQHFTSNSSKLKPMENIFKIRAAWHFNIGGAAA